MDIRFSRKNTGPAESPELTDLGLADPWLCAHIQLKVESATPGVASPGYASASFLIPSERARSTIVDLESRIASMPVTATRDGGAISMLFESFGALARIPAPDGSAPNTDSFRFGERNIWLLPTSTPDLYGGVGLAVCYSSSFACVGESDGVVKALAMERVECIARELAARVQKRFGLAELPDVAARFGNDTDARRWHEGVSDESAAQWRSMAERVLLSQHAPTGRKSSRPANL